MLLSATLGLGRALVALGPMAMAALADAQGLGLFNVIAAPSPLMWIVCLLAFDALLYAQHRAMHEIPALWRLHRVHHTDPTLDVTSAWRFHPYEIAVSLALKGALALALGAPPAAVAAYETALAMGAIFTHADIRLPRRLDAALRLVVATPAAHERHHGVAIPDQRSNYSGTLTLWDRVFGTWRAPHDAGTERLGVAEVSAQEAGRIAVGFTEPHALR